MIEVTYTYDNMNSPLKNVVGLDKIAFAGQFIDYGIFHNELTFLFTTTGAPTDSYSYTYSFNSNNFPTTTTRTGGPSDVETIQFFY